MTTIDKIFEILLSRVDEHGSTSADGSDVDLWAMDLGLTDSDFLDQIGAAVAVKYQAGLASFDFCDSLVNDLYIDLLSRIGTSKAIRWPALFDEVYLAFDAGEWHRCADKTDNPVAEYTGPLIAKIVAKLSSART